MSTFLLVSSIVVLAFVLYEDFKYRAITWFWLPLLFIVFAVGGYREIGLLELLRNAALSLGFLLMQFGLITLYFSLKERQLVNIFKHYFGIGDQLFLVSLTVAFSLLNFIVFLLASFLLTIVGYLLYSLLKSSAQKKIPLAGVMAGQLIIVLLLRKAGLIQSLYNESAILQMMTLSV